MDVTSYLLGKNSVAGEDINNYLYDSITYANNKTYRGDWALFFKKMPKIVATLSSGAYLFYGFPGTEIDMSGYTNDNINTTNRMFYECTKLTKINWDGFTFNGYLTSIQYMFYGCTDIETIDLFYTGNVSNFSNSFRMCTKLKNVPLFDTTNATDFTAMFSNCTNLTDESLNNILQMCINAYSYEGTKTLATLGFNASVATVSRIENLEHYPDFEAADWSIGY